MPPSQSEMFLLSLGKEQSDFLSLVSAMDIEKSCAYSKYDEDQIKMLVQTELGSFSDLNHSVISAIRKFCITTSADALKTMTEDEKSSNDLLENTVQLLYILGDSNAALQYLLESLAIKVARYGAEDESLGHTYNHLGIVNTTLGHLDDSLKFYQKSLNIRAQRFGNEDVSLAGTLGNIALAQQEQGKLSEALQTFQKNLNILQRARLLALIM